MKLDVKIKNLELKNPVIAASGTFGFGKELGEYFDLNSLGGISLKGITRNQKDGNIPPRIVETTSGILNSVGLQNPGVKSFVENDLVALKKYNTALIANIAGETPEDYAYVASVLAKTDIDAIEVNVSCPNVAKGGLAFGTTTNGIEEVTSAVRKEFDKCVIVKLSPNVTDISEMARAAESAGADSISLINTLLGMKIDVNTRKPILYRNTGGLSGPAVMPVAVRMVNEVSNSVDVPVIGMGGIMTGEDVVEFLLAGATAVMVGTANMIDPCACVNILDGLKSYMRKYEIDDVKELIGKVELNG